MCVVCGCSGEHAQEAGAVVAANGDLDFGANAARVSVPGLSAERAIKLEADVLGANDSVAAQNRAHFVAHGITALNLVSSPGSGKTTLLCATIAALRRRAPEVEVAVIEGDQQTSNDADRIRATGAPAVQVNTGKGCHLDAPMVAAAFEQLPLHRHHGHGHHHDDEHHGHHHDQGHAHTERLLFIENVGNLVCPALWDLGEAAKVAILSVTEGEDKPLKYPDMFAAARLMLLNKTDLLPHLDFDVERCIEYARRVNPAIEVLQVSARSGDGLDAWLDWLLHLAPQAAQAADGDAALKRRIAELEAQVRALGGQPG
ncbi:hydrogenase accessory protein HypB [Rubrivivax gelatinosus]|uniref:hydrogenase nickel incorporation protein HypB n=1 Tax=Rubrivivax gelatinosus TaxID=28068 RepID=UPI001905EF2E|nr:hydrogenase nickel incorporation protein HypB [Rubrivivax gelatinosus]MBK1615132.1 hydrogenase accessory protein HypB [Rubrivivax gelatinosus]